MSTRSGTGRPGTGGSPWPWNAVGPNFIAVHTMLDPQVDAVRGMADETAERIATLGRSPSGTPGALVAQRSWDDYSIGRAGTMEHLAALDVVYAGIIGAQRETIETAGELDQVTQDMLIRQSGEQEQFHWFVRAHLENADGSLATRGARTEKGPPGRPARARRASVPESAEAGPGSAGSAAPAWAEPLLNACRGAGEDIGAALQLAADYGMQLPQPGCGQTASRWAVLSGSLSGT